MFFNRVSSRDIHKLVALDRYATIWHFNISSAICLLATLMDVGQQLFLMLETSVQT